MNTTGPRTLFAQLPQGHTLILRRFELEGEEPSYEFSEYEGYLSASPQRVPLPEGVPDSFPSLERALESANRYWKLATEDFRDVHLGREIDLDFTKALRRNEIGPIRPGISCQEMMDLLGLPEAVTPTMLEGSVCWFYGSVQVHWARGSFQRLVIDRGEGDFTSLRLQGWFLDRTTTRQQVEEYLVKHKVSYEAAQFLDTPIIQITSAGRGRTTLGFLFDFTPDDDRIHALYWNATPLDGRDG
jgi:hypothetical protein